MASRATKWVVGSLGAGTALVAAIGAYLVMSGQVPAMDEPAHSRRLTQTLAQSQALGLPMTARELAVSSQVPDTENAANIILPLLGDVKSPTSDAGYLMTPILDTNKATVAKAELAAVDATLDKIVAGLERDQWSITRDWDQGPQLQFPEYAKIKAVAKLMTSRAVVRAMKGDKAGALADFRATRKLCRLVSTDRTLIGVLVAIAGDALALHGAEKMIQLWDKDAAALDDLVAAIESTNFTIDPRDAWKSEFFLAVTFTRNYERFGGLRAITTASEPGETPPPRTRVIIRDGEPQTTEARAMLNGTAEFWNDAFAKFGKERPASGTWGPYFDEMAKDAANSGSKSLKLASALLPVFSQADKAMVKQELQPHIHVALIRAVQFKLRTGDFPKSIADLKIETKDTFAENAPLRYLVRDGVMQIYSVGMDGEDDGGLLGPYKSGHRDIGTVYPANARRKVPSILPRTGSL